MERRGAAPFDIRNLPKYGKTVNVGGAVFRYYSIGDIARMYGLLYATVRRWFLEGWLPEPWFTRRRGEDVRVPYYLQSQVRVICLVLNDIYGQGIKNIEIARLEEHRKMMYRGCRIALEEMDLQAIRKQKRDLQGAFGVIWED